MIDIATKKKESKSKSNLCIWQSQLAPFFSSLGRKSYINKRYQVRITENMLHLIRMKRVIDNVCLYLLHIQYGLLPSSSMQWGHFHCLLFLTSSISATLTNDFNNFAKISSKYKLNLGSYLSFDLPSPYLILRQARQRTPLVEWHTEQSVLPVCEWMCVKSKFTQFILKEHF